MAVTLGGHMSESQINDQLILIVGYSATGKSAALRNIRNQDKWLYLNTEAGKRLPFKNDFQSHRITDPYQIFEAFDYGTNNPDIEGIIIDSATFMMDMFESQYVLTASNTMKAWSDYSQFFKELMQTKVTLFGKPVIIIAHVKDELDEKAMEMRTFVPVKGSLKNNGIEAYFSTVVAAKKVPLKELEKVTNNMLVITDEEREVGYKHVFQTRITKNSTGERIRSPMGMFTKEQTYIDNDAQVLLDHLNEFYS
jgi:hypothetical protein